MSEIRKVVLAYSGGLDTSVILKWLQDTYDCEVVTFTADIGQGEELEPARAKARQFGVEKIYIEDLREEFVRDFVFPMFRANTVYEGEYLLGTSIARPLIAKRLVEIARRERADAIAHGATGKGNDQVRFELGAYALMPDVKVIAPWREWDLLSREKLLAYADAHGIPVDFKKRRGGAPFSMDANLLHISYEGGVLEDPAAEPPAKGMWRLTVPVEKAPNRAEDVELAFVRGDLVAIGGQKMKAHELLAELNRLGGRHGIGRLDLVENRYVGMKSRGCYETPGGTILLRAHRAIESLTLDREVAHLKDDLMPRYASMIYNGYWWSPERRALQVLIDHTQEPVTGTVTVRLYKGNVIVVARSSANSLFDARISTFEDDAGAYDQADAGGFIKLNALRMRIAASKGDAGKGTRGGAGGKGRKGAATTTAATARKASAGRALAAADSTRGTSAKAAGVSAIGASAGSARGAGANDAAGNRTGKKAAATKGAAAKRGATRTAGATAKAPAAERGRGGRKGPMPEEAPAALSGTGSGTPQAADLTVEALAVADGAARAQTDPAPGSQR